jgi:hypothetical protein
MIAPKLRHAALLRACPELFDAARPILIAGGGAAPLAHALQRPLVAVERAPATPDDPRVTTVRGTITALPFAAGAFDTVVCADILQCVAPAERAQALSEALRVAARQVVLSVPAGAFAASAEAAYAQHLAAAGHMLPQALRASQQHGIPSFAALLALLLATGRAFTLACNESVTAHYAAQFVDEHPFLGRYLAAHDRKFPAEPPLIAAEGDLPWSYLAVIDVTARRSAAAPAPAVPAPTTRAGTFTMFGAAHRRDRMPAIPGVDWIFAGADGRDLGPDPPPWRDDTGAQISARNAGWSEMTALYWLWRNARGIDAVGFCQYRRQFDFRPGPQAIERETYLDTPDQVQRHGAHFVDRATIDRHLAAGEIIVTRPMPLPTCNPEQYAIAHVADHYVAMIDHVLSARSEYAPQVVAQARDRRLYGCNMFVMPWSDFDRLCEFWFECLFALEARLPVTRSGYHGRVFAFLSERIFDLHIRRLADEGRRIVDYPVFYLGNNAF